MPGLPQRPAPSFDEGSDSADLSPLSSRSFWEPRSDPESNSAEKPLLKSITTAARAALRFRQKANASENSGGHEARQIRRHPFFADTSREFREQVAKVVRPCNLDVFMLGSPGKADALSDALFDPLPVISASKVILQPGCRVPDELKGLILVVGGDPQDLQVLYKHTMLSSDLHESFIPGVAGQDVAFGLVAQSLFCVQKRPSTSELCLLHVSDLTILSQRYPDDYQKLHVRAGKMTCSLIRAWVRKFYMRCYPKLFCNVHQEFMANFVDLMQVKVYAAGDTMCAEGDPANSGFYLDSGRALVCRGSTSIIRLSRGQDGAWKSWWGMLEVGATCIEQTCTVKAETDCVAWVLQIRDSEELRVKFPQESCLFDRISIRHLQLLTPHMDGMRSIAMFADSGPEFQEMLSSHFVQRICSRDEVVVQEGDLGDEMFVLVLGKCKVLRSGSDRFSRLHPGSCFGGLAALGISTTRKETVRADTVCDIRALSRKALLAVLEKFPDEEERMTAIVEAHSQSRKAASLALEQASAGEGGFSQDFIRMLVDNMYEQPFMVNQVILQQGKLGTHFVVLVDGIVEIEADGMVVATKSAPGIFGERGFLVSGSRSGATVRCTTVAECMMLPVDGPSTSVIRKLYQADIQKLERMLTKKMQSTVQTLSQKGSNLSQAQQSTSFLKNCDPSFLTRMAQHLEKQVFMAGQPLLEEDVDAGFCLLIQQGMASVEKAGKVVAKIGAGEFIGELVALGFATAASQTVRADDRVLAFAINNDAFRELVDEFPEEKQKLLELSRQRIQATGRRRSSRGLLGRPEILKAVGVVSALHKKEERRTSRTQTDGLPKPPPTTDVAQVRKLPGYESGVKWVQQRRAALEEATYVKLKRTTGRAGHETAGDHFEPLMPLRPLQGYRPPEKGPGTPWSTLREQRQAMPASVMRLRKSKKLYGRNVWLETCVPWSRPSIPPASAGASTPQTGNTSEAKDSSPMSARSRPLELDESAQEDAGALTEPSSPTSPEAARALQQKLAGGIAPSLLEHMCTWYADTSEEDRSPIERLSMFLQQEEEAEESYKRERRLSCLGKGFHLWKVVSFGGGSPSGAADEPDIIDLDYSSREGGDGWLAVDIADRVTQMIDNVLEADEVKQDDEP